MMLCANVKADAVTFGGQNEVGGIPLEEVYKISHIGRLTLGVGESSLPPFP